MRFIKRLLLGLLLLTLVAITTVIGLAFLRANQLPPSTDYPKILITNFHPYHSGGHLTYIHNLTTSPLAELYEFGLAAPNSSDIYQRVQKDSSIACFDASFPGGTKELLPTFKAAIHFYRICKLFQPDIIHTNGGHDNTIAAWVSLFLPKKPVLVRTFHATKKIGKDPYHWLLYQYIVKNQIFVARSSYEYNIKQKGLKLPNAIIIENGVDLEKFRPEPFNNQLARTLGIKQNEFIFGSCAGLSTYKRVDLMLKAAAELKQDYHFKILVLGKEDRGKNLMKMAQDLNVDDIFIYGGYTEDVRPYNSLFSVGFILSDQVETISYAAREMLAMGIPLISSSYSGLKDNIRPEYNGVLIEPGNLQELKEAMVYFLTLHQDSLEAYGHHARHVAETLFSIDKQWVQIAQAYEHALQGTAFHPIHSPSPSPNLL